MRLKRIRIYADLTQGEIASILNVARSTYGMWEQEREFIPLQHLINLCDHFNVSIDYVLELNGIKQYNNAKDGFDKEILAKRIKLVRKLNDVTQMDLAKQLNVAYSSISKYENGINLPITSYLIGFAKYFNISCDYLTGKIDDEIKINPLVKN